MQKNFFLVASFFTMIVASVNGQKTDKDSNDKKHFIGSSISILGNFGSENKPDFVQLNLGYRITPKDVVSVELKTWKYSWPLGIPCGKSFQAPKQGYPGYIREVGVALVYQRFLWKGAYAAVHAFNARQTYFDDNNEKIQNGYHLFMTYRAGYHIPLFKNRFFIEPSVAITNWPINTNVPASFKILEKKWSNYFFVEPGLHFGYKF
jgi:hypothetical protein